MDLFCPPGNHCKNASLAPEGIPRQARMLSLASDEIWDCFGLRYSYFVEQRRWVAANPEDDGFERDNYDDYALHVAVSDGKGIMAYMRLLPFSPAVGFMLDQELSCVLLKETRQALPRDNAVELSRLVVRDDVSLNVDTHPHPIELLFKRFYHESKVRGFRRFYIVVEPGWLRLFSRHFGLVFQVIGAPNVFPDGTKTVAATATLEELEEGMRRHSATKFAWYEQEE